MSDIDTEHPSAQHPHAQDAHSTGDPRAFSLPADLIGIFGMTLIVLFLFYPALKGSHTLMSDSWKLNYPWAVEGSIDEAAIAQAVCDNSAAQDGGGNNSSGITPEEPYILAWDIYLESLPWFAFAKSELLAGRWPHWNPYSFSGSPLYANHLVPITHPPLLIALLIAPIQQIYTVMAFLTLWLAGLGLYLFLRWKRMLPGAVLAAAALYLTIGHFMPLVPYQMASLMCFPWLLWGSDYLEKRPSPLSLSLLSLGLGLQFASGHPAFVAPFVYFLFIHRILSWVFNRKSLSWWTPRISLLILAVILGGLLSAVQNYPTMKYLQLTSRDLSGQVERTLYTDENPIGQPSPSESATELSVTDKLSIVLSPVFQREIELEHPYVGIPLLILALIGLVFMRPVSDRNAWIVFALIFTTLAVPSIFSKIAHFIPGLGISPYTPYASAQFILVVLSAYGVDKMMSLEVAFARKQTLSFIAISIAGISVFALPLILTAILKPDTRWEADNSTLAIAVLIFGSLAVSAPAFALALRHKFPAIPGFALPLIITISGILGHFWQYPVFQPVPVMPATPSIAAIPLSNEYRVIRHSSKAPAHEGSIDNPLTFGGNLPMWAGMLDSQGYDSFVMQNQWDLLKKLDTHSLAWNGLALPITNPEAISSPLLDALAVKWVISDDPNLLMNNPGIMSSGGWKLIYAGGLNIYERPSPLPRWHLANNTVIGQNSAASLETMQSGNFRERAPGTIALHTENPQMLQFSVDSESDCWFVLSDTWHPEWKAYLDGKEVPIVEANGAFRAVEIPSGTHSLIFKYVPESFLIGLIISLATLVMLAAACFIEFLLQNAAFRKLHARN